MSLFPDFCSVSTQSLVIGYGGDPGDAAEMTCSLTLGKGWRATILNPTSKLARPCPAQTPAGSVDPTTPRNTAERQADLKPAGLENATCFGFMVFQ